MSTVLYEKKDQLAIITINRPEVMNSIDPETDKRLAEAWNQFKDDDGAFVAVITAAGDQAFCSGADLKEWPPFLAKKDARFHRRRAYEGPGFGGFTRGIGEPLTEGLRIEAMLFNSLIGTHDFSEGPAAFAEKRKPQWRND